MIEVSRWSATVTDASQECFLDWERNVETTHYVMGLFHEFIQDKEVRLIGVEHAAYLVDKDKYVTPLQNGVIGEYLGGTA